MKFQYIAGLSQNVRIKGANKNSFLIEISLPGRNLPRIAALGLRQIVILQMKISMWKDNST